MTAHPDGGATESASCPPSGPPSGPNETVQSGVEVFNTSGSDHFLPETQHLFEQPRLIRQESMRTSQTGSAHTFLGFDSFPDFPSAREGGGETPTRSGRERTPWLRPRLHSGRRSEFLAPTPNFLPPSPIRCLHHVRRGVHSGQEARPGRGLRNQRQGGPVPEPGLRGSAGPVSLCGEAFHRPHVRRRARVPGLQRAGPQLLQSPRSDLEEAHGKTRTRPQDPVRAGPELCWKGGVGGALSSDCWQKSCRRRTTPNTHTHNFIYKLSADTL